MEVAIPGGLLDSMLSFARMQHPHEAILLLRGRVSRDEIIVEEHLLPPFATAGRGFAEFPHHMLPIDFSIVGTLHSHPSGSPRPSPTRIPTPGTGWPYTTRRGSACPWRSSEPPPGLQVPI
jgi:proteasome lid subunit RPN8/RPN11